MTRKLLRIALLLVLVVGAACTSSNNFRDLEGVKSENPDLARVFNNMDGHPNIGLICIEGVAFATTTRDYTAVLRVPEWDRLCPTKPGK